VIVQYESDEEKFQIMENLDDVDLSWSTIISNEVVEFLSKEEDDD